MNPEEKFAYELYYQFCEKLEMTKEADRKLPMSYFDKTIPYHPSDRLHYFSGATFSAYWESKDRTITEMIKDGSIWDFQTAKYHMWVVTGKIQEDEVPPKLRLRIAYMLAKENIIFTEVFKKDVKWYIETEETTNMPNMRPKRDVVKEVLNDYFFSYKSDKTGEHVPITTKTLFRESYYDSNTDLINMMNETINSAIIKGLGSWFAHETFLASGLNYVHVFLNGDHKMKFSRTEAAIKLKT